VKETYNKYENKRNRILFIGTAGTKCIEFVLSIKIFKGGDTDGF